MRKIYKLKKSVLLFIGILFTCLIYSQEDYLPGFVIKNNGDTLKGFVDYRNWGVNPDKIDFRSTVNSGSTTFNPTEVKGFSVKDEIYLSGIVEVENTPVEEIRLDYDSKPNISVETVFLQTLFKGVKGLYYYRNNNGRENFYVNKDGGFELLVYKKYLVRQGTTSSIRERNDFIGQLILYFVDCPAIRTKIESTSYAQRALIKIFQDYYKCTSAEVGFQRERERVHLEIGALAGSSFTKLEFSSSESRFDYLENTDFNLSTAFSGGLFLEIIIPRNQGRFSIDNELLFSSFNTTGQYEYDDFNETHKKMTTEFEFSHLKMNNLLRYKFPVGNISLFCNAGISNGIRLSERMYVKKEFTTDYSGTTVYEGSPLDQTKEYEHGFVAGTGIKTKKISFEARVEKTDGFINVETLSSRTIRYYLILGYRF